MAVSRDALPELAPESQSALSQRDRTSLGQYRRKMQLVADRTLSVAKGYRPGCMFSGRPGIGKTYTVIETLEGLGAFYRLVNSHLTPRGLFDELTDAPDAIHIIEDAEEVLRNHVSLGTLRSATAGSRRGREGTYERLITWGRHPRKLETVFAGAVILICNRPLSAIPEAQALASRIDPLEIPVSDAEVAAQMRHLALDGYWEGDAVLDAATCTEVAEFVIVESARLGRQLDLRAYVGAVMDRIQVEDHDALCHWRDLVASSIRGRPSIVEDIVPPGICGQRKARELELARQLVALPLAEKLRRWSEEIGTSQATMYRRLSELGRIDASNF